MTIQQHHGTPLKGRIALVTGGSRGIGAAIVRRLAREGAKVAFTYAESAVAAKEIAAGVESGGGSALAVRADSRDPEAVEHAVRETVGRFGGLDILVNNAGIATAAPIEDFALAEFDRMVDVNVRGVFTATRAAVPHLGRGGRIITVGSASADRSPAPGTSVYALTKAAVAAFGRALARELGPRGITMNTVQPGPTDTDMNPADGVHADAAATLLPLGHYARPEDIAGAVAYLAGPEARCVTGAVWNIDCGFTV